MQAVVAAWLKTDRQTASQAGRQPSRQTNRRACKQAGRQKTWKTMLLIIIQSQLSTAHGPCCRLWIMKSISTANQCLIKLVRHTYHIGLLYTKTENVHLPSVCHLLPPWLLNGFQRNWGQLLGRLMCSKVIKVSPSHHPFPSHPVLWTRLQMFSAIFDGIQPKMWSEVDKVT